MRKIAWIVFCVVVCSGLLFSQSITVTKPVANEVVYKGQSYNITWTKSGAMPNQVRIALVNEAASDAGDIVQNIVTETANDGSYSWFVPMVGFSNGRYKIAIRAKGSNITGISPAFRIEMKKSALQPAPKKAPLKKMEPWVKINRPGPNKKWNFGDKEDILIETNFDAQYFRMDLTSKGQRVFPIQEGAIEPYAKENVARKYRYRWNIPVQSADNGYYRIRVKATSKEGDIEGFSEAVYLSEAVEYEIREEMLSPSKIQNIGADPEQTQSNQYAYVGKDHKSQVIFPIEELQNKNVLVLEAHLFVNTFEHDGSDGCMHSAARKLHVLTGPWTGGDPIPAYFYLNLPDKQSYRLDVRQQIVSWINGQEPNHGFLLTGPDSHEFQCYSQYSFNLKVKYREQK